MTKTVIVCGGVLVLCGCASDQSVPAETLNAAEFRESGPVAPTVDLAQSEVLPDTRISLLSEPGEPSEVVVITPEQARGQEPIVSGVESRIPPVNGTANGGDSQAGQINSWAVTGGTVLIDAKVGDINGRAIYADDFLRELEARFTQEAKQMPPAQWLQELDNAVTGKIKSLLREELLRAEALASMGEDQRTIGLSAALDRMRRRLNSNNGGSPTKTRGKILEEYGEGASVDEFLLDIQNIQLTKMILEAQVDDRVNISWREIVQEYERAYDQFNQDPEAHFRHLLVYADDAESIELIKRQLQEGVPFEEVASLEINRVSPETGGAMPPFTIKTSLDALRVFRNDQLNDAAISLGEGQYAGPIEFEVGGRMTANWVHLDRVTQVSVPLYDAQLAIAAARKQEQTMIELSRYEARLLRQASVSDLNEMRARLLRIAIERFNPDILAMFDAQSTPQ